VFAAKGVAATLTQVVRLAVSTIEGCDLAGIFVKSGSRITTPVRSDAVVGSIDAFQRVTGEGPCMDAMLRGQPCYAEDLADDPRWPRFSASAVGLGVRSVLAFPLRAEDTIGALNLYAHLPAAFGVLDRARGLLLAGLAGAALASAQAQEDEERASTDLHAALASRELIGQAQGILMERERITADQAFDVLRRAAEHLDVKLSEVARSLIETGERPAAGPTSTP
jgi:GAF domain-containing protein